MAFLDETGLARFFSGIKDIFAPKTTASQSDDGLMSAEDKTKLDGLKNGSTKEIARGTITVTVTAANGSTPGQGDATVAFPTGAFSSKPCMMAMHKDKNRVNYYRVVGYADTSISGNIRVTTTRQAQESVAVDWIAIN